MHRDLCDLGSQILIQILPKERTHSKGLDMWYSPACNFKDCFCYRYDAHPMCMVWTLWESFNYTLIMNTSIYFEHWLDINPNKWWTTHHD